MDDIFGQDLLPIIPKGFKITDQACFMVDGKSGNISSHRIPLNGRSVKNAIEDYFGHITKAGILASEIYVYMVCDFEAKSLDPRPSILIRYGILK